MMRTQELTALLRDNVDVEVEPVFNFSAVDKDEYAFYNHNERKRISQLKQIIAYYEDQSREHDYNVALLLDAVQYALDWLLDYDMGDLSDAHRGAIEKHLQWWLDQPSRSSKARARIKALEWILEETYELRQDNLWRYAEGNEDAL